MTSPTDLLSRTYSTSAPVVPISKAPMDDALFHLEPDLSEPQAFSASPMNLTDYTHMFPPTQQFDVTSSIPGLGPAAGKTLSAGKDNGLFDIDGWMRGAIAANTPSPYASSYSPGTGVGHAAWGAVNYGHESLSAFEHFIELQEIPPDINNANDVSGSSGMRLPIDSTSISSSSWLPFEELLSGRVVDAVAHMSGVGGHVSAGNLGGAQMFVPIEEVPPARPLSLTSTVSVRSSVSEGSNGDASGGWMNWTGNLVRSSVPAAPSGTENGPGPTRSHRSLSRVETGPYNDFVVHRNNAVRIRAAMAGVSDFGELATVSHLASLLMGLYPRTGSPCQGCRRHADKVGDGFPAVSDGPGPSAPRSVPRTLVWSKSEIQPSDDHISLSSYRSSRHPAPGLPTCRVVADLKRNPSTRRDHNASWHNACPELALVELDGFVTIRDTPVKISIERIRSGAHLRHILHLYKVSKVNGTADAGHELRWLGSTESVEFESQQHDALSLVVNLAKKATGIDYGAAQQKVVFVFAVKAEGGSLFWSNMFSVADKSSGARTSGTSSTKTASHTARSVNAAET